jgi:hypothetical protein
MDAGRCVSIRSKKKPGERCEAKAKKGDFCARHCKSKILWSADGKSVNACDVPATKPLTRKQTSAIQIIHKFWLRYGRRYHRNLHGPAIFTPSIAQNDKDVFTFQPISTIPYSYHFSYTDSAKHVWIFDIRFLVQLLHYGQVIKNPFSQEDLPASVLERLESAVSSLRRQGLAIVYTDEVELTPEQVWNQKVLDVFLKINSLGYGVNILWFETMNIRHHENFYIHLHVIWDTVGEDEKEIIVPGYSTGRAPLFRWFPDHIIGRGQDVKWWRKCNLGLMNALVTRGQTRTAQSSGALHVLTALANSYPPVAESFNWLVYT